MRLEPDVNEADGQRALADDRTYLGSIRRVGPAAWKNTHVATGGLLSPVPESTFETLTLAFDAFKTALDAR